MPAMPDREIFVGRSRWPRILRRGSAVPRLLGLRVRVSPGAWESVLCECRVLWGRGLCVGPITRLEESCWGWCVWVWSRNLEKEEALAYQGCRTIKKSLILKMVIRMCVEVTADVAAQRIEKANGHWCSKWKVCLCRNYRPTLSI